MKSRNVFIPLLFVFFIISLPCANAQLGVVLPNSFPEYNVEYNQNVAPGYIYLNLQFGIMRKAYNVIMSNEGEIVYFRKVDQVDFFEFKPFPAHDKFATFRFSSRAWEVFDLNYELVDEISVQNGYISDAHELLIREDNHIWLIGQNHVEMDMSELVPDGNEEALVAGIVLQELDENRDVIWEWHSLDHISVLETDTVTVDLTDEDIDYMHTNSIDIGEDGHIVISSKHLNEVTKINYDTHEIIWRMGAGRGNQFTFIDDDITTGFTQQHHARWLDNGNLLLFDNGLLHPNHAASAKEYEVDEMNLTATLVWSYYQDPYTYSFSMGGADRLDNNNTLISWGTPSSIDSVVATEVTESGEVAWQLTIPINEEYRSACYRAFKTDMIGSGSKPYLVEETTDEGNVFYMNHFGQNNITGYEVYIDEQENPETMSAISDTNVFYVQNLVPGNTYYARIKSIDSDGNTSEFSNLIEFEFSELSPVTEETLIQPQDFILLNAWPNPFNSTTRLSLELQRHEEVDIRIFDILGRQVASIFNGALEPGHHSVNFTADDLSSGIYFVSLQTNSGQSNLKKLILLR